MHLPSSWYIDVTAKYDSCAKWKVCEKCLDRHKNSLQRKQPTTEKLYFLLDVQLVRKASQFAAIAVVLRFVGTLFIKNSPFILLIRKLLPCRWKCLPKVGQKHPSKSTSIKKTTNPIRLTIGIPAETLPNIVCFPSSHGVGARVIKNWLPFVFGPLLAIAKIPAPTIFNCGFNSSSNASP